MTIHVVNLSLESLVSIVQLGLPESNYEGLWESRIIQRNLSNDSFITAFLKGEMSFNLLSFNKERLRFPKNFRSIV